MPNTLCVCGHERDAHEHYRRGTDCATCGPETCPKFRRPLLRRATPPAPPSTPSVEPAKRDEPSLGSQLLATRPLAIVSDLRVYAARRTATT